MSKFELPICYSACLNSPIKNDRKHEQAHMTMRHESPVRFTRFITLILLVAAALTACSDRSEAVVSSAASTRPAEAPDYNALIAALPPLAPKSELETSVEFMERKRQRLTHLSGNRFLFTVPVRLGKCKVSENGETDGVHEYVGLRYDADNELLQVCTFDAAAIPPSAPKRSYGMLITDGESTTNKSIATGLMGASVEINERTTRGKAIFVDLPTNDARDFAHARIPLKFVAAKDLLANGGRFVYDVVLDPERSGDVMTSSIKTRANMSRRESIDETIIGLTVKVRSIALESSTGVLIARFELDTEGNTRSRMALVPDRDSQTGGGEATTTRQGILRIGEGGAYLDGEKVFSLGMYESLRVVALHQLGQHDVVVAEVDSGGAAGYVSVVLLDVGPGRKVTEFREDYVEARGLRDPASEIRKIGNILVVDRGFAGGKHRKLLFDGKTLSTTLETSRPTPIPDALCGNVHAVIEACAMRHSAANDCVDTFDNISRVERGRIDEAFEYPAQIEEAFKLACDTACTTGSAPKYSQTKNEICAASIP